MYLYLKYILVEAHIRTYICISSGHIIFKKYLPNLENFFHTGKRERKQFYC